MSFVHVTFYFHMKKMMNECSLNFAHDLIRVFPVLYLISLISRIRRIKLESLKHNRMLLKDFLCLSIIVDSLV